jgi:radical SAM superfamily enzyme YgiQ (UPF0313 family)
VSSVLLLNTYDLGRQPFGLASPAAWLRRAGHDVALVDLSRDRLPAEAPFRARLAAFYLPMHAATRLALPVIDRLRAEHPGLTLVAYGLYAPLNEALLRTHGVQHVLGPEAEGELAEIAGAADATGAPGAPLPRVEFIQPDRKGLPPLSRYASLQMPDGTRKVVGATEATRGCKHRCRHCPIVPVYDGRFRAISADVVLADVRAQVEAGAEHITFGDPDFLNGPTHARRIAEALHDEWPALTYDVTIKIEHLVSHRHLLPVLARTGCLFVTSAVESVDDEVLAKLEKGHTRADFVEAARLCGEAGLVLAPTFVAFTPWTTVEAYAALLDIVEQLGLVDHVAPIQWGIRLLVTHGSRLLELEEIRRVIRPFDPRTLTYPWRHPDPRIDRLHADVMTLIARRPGSARRETFRAIRARVASHSTSATNLSDASQPPPYVRAAVPYLNEPWYC